MPVAKSSSGININYEITGGGPPLLLISGTGHDLTFWGRQLDMLGRHFQCITFDNRGVGRSSAPEPGYSLADMAGDAAAVLDHAIPARAGVARAHVMGFSMGGHIAQELALARPGMIISLGIHHSWAAPDPRLTSFQATRKALAERGMRDALADVSLLALFEQGYYQAHLDDMAARRVAMIGQMGDLKGWIGQLEACIHGDTAARLGAITAPTLVTASDRDMIVATHRAEEIQGAIAGARLVVMAGTGHVALIERPDEFAGICLDFLAGVEN